MRNKTFLVTISADGLATGLEDQITEERVKTALEMSRFFENTIEVRESHKGERRNKIQKLIVLQTTITRKIALKRITNALNFIFGEQEEAKQSSELNALISEKDELVEEILNS